MSDEDAAVEEILPSPKKLNNEDEDDFASEFNNMCSLTRKQRLYGFLGCFCIGWLLSFLSLFTIAGLVTGNPRPFAILYTLGNILALASLGSLWGPMSQLKGMFKPIRAVATLVYLLCIAATLYVAFGYNGSDGSKVILIVICLFCQFCAMVWYALSYIPYGRAILRKCLGNCFSGIEM